jgi:hypothetical protein
MVPALDEKYHVAVAPDMYSNVHIIPTVDELENLPRIAGTMP